MSAEEIPLERGQVWRVKRTGTLRVIVVLKNCASDANPYYDVGWSTTERPFRRGATYQEYWYRNCELVEP